MGKADDDNTTPPPGNAPERINQLFDHDALAPVLGRPTADPLPAVPLCELPGWVARRYGVATRALAGDLVLAVRRITGLRHRIHFRPDRITGRLPPGLAKTYDYPRRVVVVDWEAAEADWGQGTVVVLRLPDGSRCPLPIEVLWEDVELYVSLRLQQWMRNARPPPAALPSPDVPSDTPAMEADAPKQRRGRRAHPAWGRVLLKLHARLDDDGAPAAGDGGQADLERYVAGLFPPDDSPSESTIRRMVSKAIEEHRQRLNKGP